MSTKNVRGQRNNGRGGKPTRMPTPRPVHQNTGFQSLTIFWDWDSCPVPATMTFEDALWNLKATLYQMGFVIHEIHMAGDESILTASLVSIMANAACNLNLKMNVTRVEPDDSFPKERDPADLFLINSMSLWSLLRTPPAPMMVLTSDKDYINSIRKAKDNGFRVIISYMPGKTGPDLPKITEGMIWDKLVRGQLMDKSYKGELFSQTLQSPNRRDKPPPGSVMVLWDLISCPKPEECSYADLEGNIRKVLRSLGYGDFTTIQAYVRSDEITEEMTESLENAGIDITTVPPPTNDRRTKRSREYVDMRISGAIYDNLASSPSSDVSSILLISDNKKLVQVSKDVSDNNYSFILAHTPAVDKRLEEAVKLSLDWDTLANGSCLIKRDEREKPKKKRRGRDEREKPKKKRTDS